MCPLADWVKNEGRLVDMQGETKEQRRNYLVKRSFLSSIVSTSCFGTSVC